MKNEIKIHLLNLSKRTDALASHDMFKQLSGNPTSITMIAAIHANPMIKQRLLEMYKLIKSEKNIVVDELGDDGDEQAIPRVYKNTMSLKISTEMSVKLLEEADNLQMLYFLGCLPGGVNRKQLLKMREMEQDRKQLDQSIKNLDELSFLESGVEKVVLTPYMISYTES